MRKSRANLMCAIKTVSDRIKGEAPLGPPLNNNLFAPVVENENTLVFTYDVSVYGQSPPISWSW